MVALHAAAIEIGDGVVVLPGVSNSGKSTLAAQLVERGHGYLTDETVVIGTGDQRVRPYPKALCLEAGSHSVLPHLEPPPFEARGPVWDVDPATIGPGRTSTGGRVTTLVFPIYRPGATAVVRRMDPVEVLHRLLRNTFAIPPLDQSGFAALIRLADGCGGFELAHGGVGHLELVEQVAAEGPTISL